MVAAEAQRADQCINRACEAQANLSCAGTRSLLERLSFLQQHTFGHDRLCAHSVTSEVALPSERLFLVFSFDSSANDSLFIHSIDAQSKVAAICFVWCYFRLEPL